MRDEESTANQVTIVTGGGRGIGAATAVRLARLGHSVVVNYLRDRDAAERLMADLASEGHQVATVRADVTEEAEVERLFAEAHERFGQVTGLVNNAGATLHIGDLADTPVEVIRQVIELNLVGVILCARRASQVMSTRRGGRGGVIVNVSSAAATLGSAHEYVHYAAAKAGVDGFTIGLAKELAGDGIRVNAVSPGLVRTDIHAGAGQPDRADKAAGRVPVGRAGDPAEIANAIGWLLGPEATYASGAVLRVAGGM